MLEVNATGRYRGPIVPRDKVYQDDRRKIVRVEPADGIGRPMFLIYVRDRAVDKLPTAEVTLDPTMLLGYRTPRVA